MTQDFANNSDTDGSTVERQTYEVGANNVLVEHFKVTGGGHTWPGTFLNGFGTNQDINASLEIWNFLAQYKLNELTGITTSIASIDNKAAVIKVYPNPISSYLTIEKAFNQPTDYRLVTITGKEVLSGTLQANNTQIDIAHLLEGIYFLEVGNTAYKLMKME